VQEYVWGDKTANKTTWTEMIRGKDIGKDLVSGDTVPPAASIADQKLLGRIKIGMFDGICLL